MKIDVICPDCDTKYRVGEEHAGKKIRCKQCQSVVEIPAAAAVDDELGGDDDEFSWDEAPAPKRSASGGGLPPRVRRNPVEKQPREIPRQKPKWEGGSGVNHQLVIALVGGAAIIGLLIAGLFKPDVGFWGGIGLLGIGNLFTYFHAVENNCGLWYRFIPLYSIYYTFTNLQPLWHWAIIRAGGAVVLILAIVMNVRQGIGEIDFDDLHLPTEYSMFVSVWTDDLPDDADEDPGEREDYFQSPNPDTIREQVNQLPWDNPKLAFEVMLQGPADEKQEQDALMLVRGSRGGPVDQPPRIIWDHWNLTDEGQTQQSPALQSADEAIEILTAFATGDAEWNLKTTWVPAPEDELE
ncbi:MAG: hypothetical protein ACK5Q5_22165 [Planctomycetaceae bacterium]